MENRVPAPLAPDYNVAPTKEVYAVVERPPSNEADQAGVPPERQLRVVRWGLVPSWAKDPAIGNRMANARSDTAFEKPSFKRAILNRRCLIPADVFYEWQVVPGQRRKQPFAVRMKDGETFALGGIWDYWKASELSEGIVSCAILTTEPNTLLAPIHDRMPVIIPPDRYRAWLDRQDLRPAYALLHRLLRFLQWQKRRRGETAERWVLKAPMHLGFLDLLFETFPDARLIQTHRDPFETIPSLASFYFALWGLATEKPDPLEVGRQCLARWSAALRRCLALRETLPKGRVVDVSYRDVARDPLRLVARGGDFGEELFPGE